VAALDRQHPRDLFDVMHMVSLHGLRPDIVDAFVGYLSGHNRPIHEVLFGPTHSMAEAYDSDFIGMTAEPVDLAVLEETQKRLHRELPASLTENHRRFLISLVRAEPDWSLMPYAHLRELPALKWKLINLENLKKKKPEVFARQESALRENFARLDQEHAPADAVTDTTPTNQA
jgi:hypothetical protein